MQYYSALLLFQPLHINDLNMQITCENYNLHQQTGSMNIMSEKFPVGVQCVVIVEIEANITPMQWPYAVQC